MTEEIIDEAEAKKKAAPAKPVEKPDSFEMIEPEIEHDDKDKFVHGAKHNDDFRKKYGDKWRAIANALAHVHTHYYRSKRDR